MKDSASGSPSPTRGRAMLVGLLLVFAAPLLVAVALYSFRSHLPAPQPNVQGNLIQPVSPITRFDLFSLGGKRIDSGFLRGKWTLVYVGGSHCDLRCEASLFKMRQVRLVLGSDRARVQRLYVLTDTRALASLRPLLRRHPGMTVAQPRDGARHAILAPFDAHSGTFFLIDPQANLMMRYPPDATSEELKEDLTHLLEVSRVG